MTAKLKIPTLAAVEKHLGEKAIYWAGRCYEIAYRIVECELVEGEPIYGHYLGHVEPGTLFAGRSIIQHGWILLPDGRIMDPTRWVFLGVDPFLYVGEDHQDYDRGGNKMREAFMRPFPAFNEERAVKDFFPPKGLIQICAGMAESMAGFNVWSVEQLSWVANLPYHVLEEYTNPLRVYKALEKVGLIGFVPIDNLIQSGLRTP